METPNTDRMQAGGWHAEGAGDGEGLHVREAMLVIDPFTGNRVGLVVRLFADWWVTTVEEWEDS